MIDLPAEWAALPGTITIRVTDDWADALMRNAVAVIVEHDISPDRRPHSIRYAGVLTVSREMLADGAMWPGAVMGCDQWIRPWLYPERYCWPEVILFPRLDRLARWWSRRRLRRSSKRRLRRIMTDTTPSWIA